MTDATVATEPDAAIRPDRAGIIAVVPDHQTLDRVRGMLQDLRIGDELQLDATFDAALRRMREGAAPRVLLLDLSDSPTPFVVLGNARKIGGDALKIVALGTVNDVGLYRDLIAAGASDYLVKPVGREAFAASLKRGGATGSAGGWLGQVVAFVGSRGGVGTTTTAVACAWLLAEQHDAPTVLLDLNLHFGSVALKLDIEPGSGLCEALEQPSRIDALFVDRATVKITDRLRVLAAEAPVDETLIVDAGALDALLYELHRKFAWVVVDLPRWVTPAHRIVLGVTNRVAILCERSLDGLRDTIRLQAFLREYAPQSQVMLIDSGAAAERAGIGRSEFEKAVGKKFDVTLSHDVKAAAAAANAGQPVPVAVPRSSLARDTGRLAASLHGSGARQKRKIFGMTIPYYRHATP
ncbi:MAG: CpaE family protein [Alphaproteobacteria bacterium]